MKFNDLKLGMSVKVKLNPAQSGRDFDNENNDQVGIVEQLDHEDGCLSVYVSFDNGDRDWGNHQSLVALDAEQEKVDRGTISDKLAEIERLVKEVKEML